MTSDLVERLRKKVERFITMEATHTKTLEWEAADRIAQLEAALKPLCCTCDRAASDECSRAEVDCPFWNARAALGEERT
jgi:hypothetical protein